MGMDELIDLFAEGDELVSNTAFEDLDLAYDVATARPSMALCSDLASSIALTGAARRFATWCFAVAALSAATWKAAGSAAVTSLTARHRDSTCSRRACRACRLDRAI